ncbi:ESAT-6-like protein EsxB [Mycobacterium gallinarum]|uniref:ESAT-6-like protein n=1 Tax=Mycobacterium gallinarum TaxID=39689 RepID=A0A9W4B5V9_9MYCO|nr:MULTISPECIES: WXG100 family type VII secretion target [Mycobacterium]MDV3131484.1 WXG100 family type VII secretion target [Mycobacterium sp. 29Ha]BBY94726.1 ESAT-6-like protein EsxB [Mycobacterium gallinarum]
MPAGMETDAAVLAKEAGNFERISGELQAIMSQVDATANGLRPAWQGDSGTAAQAALVRYQEAAQTQRTLLDEISMNIHSSGTDYTATDTDQASVVQTAMTNMGI